MTATVHHLVDDVVRSHAAKAIVIPSDEDFENRDFLPAPELRSIADMLRARHDMPTEISIEVVWKRKGGKKQGKETLGFCMKTSGLARFYSEHDFVIWISADVLRERLFTAAQIEALMFHELHHAGVDPESLEPIVIGHDFEGFIVDLEEYGLWRDDFTRAAESFRQARMDLP